jgi:hypothetical protein
MEIEKPTMAINNEYMEIDQIVFTLTIANTQKQVAG